MKKKLAWVLLAAMTVTFAACGSETNSGSADNGQESLGGIEESCAEVLQKIYETATTEDDFFSYAREYENIEITEENEEAILGTTEIDFTDSVYSAPMMTSIAYQCVLLRTAEGQDVEAAKKLLEENANPRKWVCVEAESVVVENIGDMILFIMADTDVANAVKEVFFSLEK